MNQNPCVCKITLIATTLFSLITFSGNLLAQTDPPPRCSGYGNLQSISLTDWESGLDSWTVGTHDVANPGTFDTADWAVVGSLPDSRAGMAAFVADLDIGDCAADDETGALTLDSPSIVIPGGVQVPRVSVDHWYETEFEFDGGNLKISVNGGPYNLVPASAIEINSYNGPLEPALDESGFDNNTNPLAGQDTFTGTANDLASGSWRQSRINLLGIAEAGDTIQLRFDFGVDACDGAVGWYVDEVEFYNCGDELPPSACGNSVIDPGEQCDDGNDFIADGCSNICQIENGWQCTAPLPPGDIADPSFEAGRPNPFWTDVSNNSLGTPICDLETCFSGGGTGPSDGVYWAWFGGVLPTQVGSVSQSVVIPSHVTELTFDLEVPACDSGDDFLEVLLDGNREMIITGTSQLCGIIGYARQSVDISNYADGATHDIEFHSETFSNNGDVSNFFVDLIAMPGIPSICTASGPSLTLVKKVINDNGGSAIPADWTLSATGPTSFSGNGPEVISGDGFMAGTYDLAESGGPTAYSPSTWDCVGGVQNDGDTVTLSANDNVTCTITNDDSPSTSLMLVKEVINNHGGTATASDWTLSATGPQSFSGSGPNVSSGPNLTAGTYDLSESGGPVGYNASDWICVGGTQIDADTLSISEDESATCTITNDDINPSFEINAGHSGAWFFSDTSGQGQFIDVEPENKFMFVSWFTYTDAASTNPFEQRWLTAQGNYSGNLAQLDLYETLGGRFDDPQEVTTTLVGEVILSFEDCEQGLMTYSIDAENLQGEFPLQRVIPGSGNVCQDLDRATTQAVDINAGMDGSWFDPITSGQGFFMDAHPDPVGGNFIFVSWFTYGEDTASGQRWLTAQGGFEGSGADKLDVFETTGGSFDDPQAVSTTPVGTMTIDFTDCSNALLSYLLTDDSLQGDIEITRVIPDAGKLCEDLAVTSLTVGGRQAAD